MSADPAVARQRALLAGGAFVLLAVLVVVGMRDTGPALYLRLGEQSFSKEFAREKLGEDVPVRLVDKHDGEWFWNLARDPLLLDVEGLDRRLDRPLYRSQRILYPALASPFRLGGEHALVWGMVLVNLAVVAWGCRLALRYTAAICAPPALVLAYIGNPAVFMSPFLGVSDALGVTCLLALLLAAHRRSLTGVALASVAAALAKEPMIAGLVGFALLAPRVPWRMRLAAVVPGVVAAVTWAGYVRLRFDTSDPQVQEFQVVPLRGLVDTWRQLWLPTGSLAPGIAATALVAAAGFVLWRVLTARSAENAMAAPFAAMVPFYTPQVLTLEVNSYRSVGPLLTLLLWDLYARRHRDSDRSGSTDSLAAGDRADQGAGG